MNNKHDNNCNSTTPDLKSTKPYIAHSLKDGIGVTENIKHKSAANHNTNDTGMQHQ